MKQVSKTYEKQDGKNYGRIDAKTARMLIVTAVFFDILSFIPGVNEVTSIAAQTILPYIFSSKNVNIFTLRRIAPYIGTWIVELIPGVSFIPALTLETLYFIYQVRKEDSQLTSANQMSK
jgi:hypothetical protein